MSKDKSTHVPILFLVRQSFTLIFEQPFFALWFAAVISLTRVTGIFEKEVGWDNQPLFTTLLAPVVFVFLLAAISHLANREGSGKQQVIRLFLLRVKTCRIGLSQLAVLNLLFFLTEQGVMASVRHFSSGLLICNSGLFRGTSYDYGQVLGMFVSVIILGLLHSAFLIAVPIAFDTGLNAEACLLSAWQMTKNSLPSLYCVHLLAQLPNLMVGVLKAIWVHQTAKATGIVITGNDTPLVTIMSLSNILSTSLLVLPERYVSVSYYYFYARASFADRVPISRRT